jgi:hypothetical protein
VGDGTWIPSRGTAHQEQRGCEWSSRHRVREPRRARRASRHARRHQLQVKAPAHAGARGRSAAQETRGVPRAGRGVGRGPRSVLAVQPHARERRLQEPEVPITRLDDHRDRHAAQDRELVHHGRRRRLGIGGIFGRCGLGRHVGLRLQRRCHGGTRGTDAAHACERSGSAHDGTAPAIPRLELLAVRELHLALLAARVTDERVVWPACAGRLFLCMAGATVPYALSEGGHERSLCGVSCSCDRETWRGTGCKRYAAGPGESGRGLRGARTVRQGILFPSSAETIARVRT